MFKVFTAAKSLNINNEPSNNLTTLNALIFKQNSKKTDVLYSCLKL